MDEISYPFFLSVSKNLLGLARPQKANNFSFFIFGRLVVLIFDLIILIVCRSCQQAGQT